MHVVKDIPREDIPREVYPERELLGDPARCDEVMGVRACTWGDDQAGINVNFIAGQVLLFSAKNLK